MIEIEKIGADNDDVIDENFKRIVMDIAEEVGWERVINKLSGNNEMVIKKGQLEVKVKKEEKKIDFEKKEGEESPKRNKLQKLPLSSLFTPSVGPIGRPTTPISAPPPIIANSPLTKLKIVRPPPSLKQELKISIPKLDDEVNMKLGYRERVDLMMPKKFKDFTGNSDQKGRDNRESSRVNNRRVSFSHTIQANATPSSPHNLIYQLPALPPVFHRKSAADHPNSSRRQLSSSAAMHRLTYTPRGRNSQWSEYCMNIDNFEENEYFKERNSENWGDEEKKNDGSRFASVGVPRGVGSVVRSPEGKVLVRNSGGYLANSAPTPALCQPFNTPASNFQSSPAGWTDREDDNEILARATPDHTNIFPLRAHNYKEGG